jgi:hypothetical protein
MLADGNAEYAKALGLELDASGYGMGLRGQRFAIIVKDGVATQVNVEAPGRVQSVRGRLCVEAALGYPLNCWLCVALRRCSAPPKRKE